MKCCFGFMTDFSIGKSLIQANRVCKAAKEAGYDTIAVTDDMTVSSSIMISRQAQKEGMNFVFGVKLRVYKDPTYRKPAKRTGIAEIPNPFCILKIYPKSEEGIKSIYRILTLANTDERFYYNPRCGWEDLKELKDCIVTTGDFYSLFALTDYEERTELLIDVFGQENVLIEIVPLLSPLFDKINKRGLMMVEKHGLLTIADEPVLYEKPEHADSLDVLKAVATNTSYFSGTLEKQPIKGLCINDQKTLCEHLIAFTKRLKVSGHALTETQRNAIKRALKGQEYVAERCAYVFEKKAPCLPKMAEDEYAELVRQCKVGWKKRFTAPVLGYKPDADKLKEVYVPRLKYELDVIKRMGFANYFLVVSDLVAWSKRSGIIVGPGRGSVGGSLVAYLTGITEIDPIRFNLIFERFINPSRHDLPDADLDYQSSRRHEIIEYLTTKYGTDRVSGISNYTSMASASAIRDVGRVFGLTPLEMSPTKLVPKENGISFNITEAADAVPEIAKFRETYPVIWQHALNLEGVQRSLGQHAAGTVVAGEPLTERAVVEHRSEGQVVNWDKRVVEDCGLIKMDILGLSTLDVLQIAQRYIKDDHGIDIDYMRINLDDEKVFDEFGRGNTTGVFQFESSGMKGLLKNLAKGGRLNFEEITATTALFRPGPMDSGLMDEYVQIKQGYTAPHYDHPAMRDALQSTNGIMIYQEQIMQVSRDLCGFTMSEADLLRKATAKKNADAMRAMKESFVNGATSGFIEVELEDGTKKKIHRLKKLTCTDGEQRTAEDIFNNGYEVANFN